MKMRLLAVICAFLLPSLAIAQTHTFPATDSNNVFTGTNTFQGDLSTHLLQYTVANLPAPASVMSGLIVVVTDTFTAGTCTPGGGTVASLCRNSGSAWVALVGAGAGGGGVSSLNTLTGGVVLAPGTNVTMVPVGNTITINSSANTLACPGTSDTMVLYNSGGNCTGSKSVTVLGGNLGLGDNVSHTGGTARFFGLTSGEADLSAATVAGAPNRLVLPISTANPGYTLSSDGGNPQQLSWIPASGTGTVTNIATTAPLAGGPITTTGTLTCATCVVATAPGAGIARFAGGTQTATSAELSGDATTSASNAVTVAKVNGTTVPTNAAADQVPVTTASAVTAWKTIADTSAGNLALTYTPSTHAFGTIGVGGSGTVNTGTAGHLAYYATSTTAVSDMGSAFTFAGNTLTGNSSSLLDLSASPAIGGIKIPVAAGAAPVANGAFAYDTTAQSYMGGVGGVSYKLPGYSGSAPAANNCVDWLALTKLGDFGLPCFNPAVPGPIGGSTPAAGTFTSVTDTGIATGTQCVHANSAGLFSGTGSDCSAGGAPAFSAITAGTNTTAAMVLGTGSSLTTSGTGTLSALPASTGTVSLKPATTDSNFYVSINGNDSNDGLSWGSAKLTVSAALTALSANGGHINIGCGTFSYGTVLSVTKPGTIISGSGWGQSNTDNGCTILNPAAGVSGIDVSGAGHVILENFRLASSSSGAGADQGIRVHGNSLAPTIRNVTVESFGSHGINLDSSSAGNVDMWVLDHIRILIVRGDGFEFTGGNDVNVGHGDNLDATGCTGWGYKSIGGNGVRSSVFTNLHASLNTAGGYDWEAGSSNKFFGVYAEGGATSTWIFGASFSLNEVWFDWFGQPATITNSGGQTNVLHSYDLPLGNVPVQNNAFTELNGLAQTPTDTYELLNTTASTAGVQQQYSPCERYSGTGWDSTNTISNVVDFRICNATSGASFGGYGNLTIYGQRNGGGYSTLSQLSSFGGLTIPGGITSSIATGTPPFAVTSTTPVANLSIGGKDQNGIVNFNQAAQSQVVVSATQYYLTNSDLDMPAVYTKAIAAGTTMKWRISLNKTAAGTGTFQILLKKGTAGSIADATLVTQTIGTQTAVADNMEADIQLTWTSATDAYWTIIPHQAAASGTGFGLVYPAVAAQFNGTISGQTTTTASDKYGLSVIFTTGTPTFVADMVQAQAFGVN